MPRRKVQVEGQLDLLSLNKEIEKAKKENPIPEEKVAKKETSKRTRKTTTNVQKKAVPHPATPETAKKSYTKEQYAEAVQMVEDRGVIYVGVLINHFRISANTAISIMNQMRKENLVTENGVLVNYSRLKTRACKYWSALDEKFTTPSLVLASFLAEAPRHARVLPLVSPVQVI